LLLFFVPVIPVAPVVGLSLPYTDSKSDLVALGFIHYLPKQYRER